MKAKGALTAAALSLLPLGQPLLLGTAGITTATTAVLLQALAAVAQDASAVAKVAKAITVRIEGATQGSGVLVKKDGNRYTVLTAWHVVSSNRPGEEVGIYTSDGQDHQLKQGSIQRLGEIDMAVLTFSSSGNYEVASIGDAKTVQYDDPIYVAGFPLANSQNLRYETGDVVANAEVGIDQGYQLLYDNKTAAGMSGGVLLNADGELIGLHGRGEKNEYASNGNEVSMKTGVNQGVPISYYKLFLSGSPVVVANNTAANADDYYAQVLASANKKGREQTMVRLADQALKLRKTGFAYIMRAYAKNDLGDYQGAIDDQNNALEINPDNAVAYVNRGLARSNMGDPKSALSDFSKAIKIDPANAMAFSNRGVSKQALGDPQGALDDYNKAIKIDPRNANAYANRGVNKGDLGDYQGAIADYSKAIGINPQHSDAYYNRGIAKLESKDYQGAIADYNKAIRIGTQNARIYLNRGLVYDNLGDYQRAIADYNKAIELDPQYALAYVNRGLAKIKSGDIQGAIADSNKAIELDPRMAKAYANRGAAKGMLDDAKGGCADFKKAASLGSQLAAQWLNRADAAWCRNMR
ncbi:tetratricopeptide repeat-containing S1 family peptidase [Prochlorococcus marinus]|uniref:Uncharacterized protein n=1 Tax=Prochlorococcus marinus (strain MIT 9303) TaxID=59922 RepID=A2CDN4_PROM3|nr:serine protease [Prochlorococcus marinus]ABM79594.1 Hypothetical protein P9303_28641 [Prochlorococcus marinus str. MIT 9303]